VAVTILSPALKTDGIGWCLSVHRSEGHFCTTWIHLRWTEVKKKRLPVEVMDSCALLAKEQKEPSPPAVGTMFKEHQDFSRTNTQPLNHVTVQE